MRMETIAALALVLLTGCGGRVETAVQSFAGSAPPKAGETVVVLPATDQGRPSLESQSWAQLTEVELRKRGFVILPADGQQRPDLVVVVGIAIDGGRDVTRSYAIPQFGVVGYSGAQTTGYVSPYGGYSGTTTFTPQYGVTGYIPGITTSRVHKRTALLRIFRVSHGPNAPPVFEITGTSEGSCGMLGSVAPAIVQGMLEDFPKPGARRTQVAWQGQC